MLEPNQDIRPAQLAAMLQAGAKFVLLDVRETAERRVSVLTDNAHIPLGEIDSRMQELDPAVETVVYCRSGARSGQVARFLRAQGFANVRNLTGGINAWAREIDNSVRTY